MSDFDFDNFEDEDDDEAGVRFVIAVGRSSTIEAFRTDVDALTPDRTTVTNILPLDADSERRRYVAVIVGQMTDAELDSLHEAFRNKMMSSEDFSHPAEMEAYVTENYGDDLWGEIQEFPLSLDETEAYEIFAALMSTGRLALARGTLDGKAVGLISHPISLGGNQRKTVPLAILVNEDLAKRIVNPLA